MQEPATMQQSPAYDARCWKPVFLKSRTTRAQLAGYGMPPHSTIPSLPDGPAGQTPD